MGRRRFDADLMATTGVPDDDLTHRREHMRHRRRVDEREQHQDKIERVHRQRTIMLRPLWSDKRSQLNGSNVSWQR
jgi:hypothetical protein